MEPLAEKIKNVAANYREARVCVAVSGGSDSMCLLDCLLRCDIIAKERLSVVNVDHGIRGAESARDSAFVRNYCAEHGLRLVFRRADIPALAAVSGRGIETEARLFRRALFGEIVSGGGADVIFTAHNADDNTETILMHIFRGCGLGGLGGMKICEGNICRPLLRSDKAEILDYIREHEVPYVEDSTNADDKYTRNFIRLRVLPLIKTRYPGIGNALGRLSSLAECALQQDADWEKDSGSVKLPPTEANGQNVRAAFIAAGLTADFSRDHIASVEALAACPTGTGVDLPHGYRAERECDCVRIFAAEKDFAGEAPFRMGLTVLGNAVVSVSECVPKAEKTTTVIDLGKLPPDAVIRTRRSGDRFRPFGGREKSLSDWLIDKKIPRFERRKLLYIASGAEVLCIIGVATGEKLKIDAKTAKAALVSRGASRRNL